MANFMFRLKQNGFALFEILGAIVVIAIIILVGLQVFNKTSNESETSSSIQEFEAHKTLKGVSLSPISFSAENFGSFFTKATETSDAITWAGKWTDLQSESSAPYTLIRVADQYEYIPLVIVGTHIDTLTNYDAIEPLSDSSETKFVETLMNFAQKYQPEFIGIGNEVNRLSRKDPADYERVKNLFSRTAKAVKAVSSGTTVFVTFQFEELNGLRGGLFGGVNDENDHDWALLDDFPDSDLAVFTTYPYLIYKDPDDIPNDYYQRISSHTTKQVAFTELGWPSNTEAVGYESSEAEQAEFLTRFGELVSTLKPRFVIWPFLYEQEFSKPFTSIGLIHASGTPKSAYTVWQNLKF